MDDLSLVQTSAVLGLPGVVSECGLVLPDSMGFDDWAGLGVTLGRIGRAAMWWIGDWLNYGERTYGEKYAQAMNDTGYDYQTLADAAWTAKAIELSRRRESLSFAHHRTVAALPPAQQREWLEAAAPEGHDGRPKMTRSELRAAVQRSLAPVPPPFPRDRFRCVVIDPPWPAAKIEREVRPKQGPVLDYPTMSEIEIAALPIGTLADPDGCHVYLWVTHKHLPMGLRCLEAWGVRYQCVMTWVKNVGMTPYSWMYSTEHVLFGRIGSLELLRLGMRLDFAAKGREHSRKPEEFYEMVAKASPEKRLDMFGREQRDGFVVWGNEPDRFAAVAAR